MKRSIYIFLIVGLLSACAKRAPHTAERLSQSIIQSSVAVAERVYFPFASDYILPETEKLIVENVAWMESNPDIYIILEGHCDDVGPSEYNMELGDRRARAVKAYMIDRGIPAERIIMVVSFGSARPLNLGHEIADLRENRRVEFVVR